MKLRMSLAVVALVMLPGMVWAAACGSTASMQCPEGQVWDAEDRACVTPVTG